MKVDLKYYINIHQSDVLKCLCWLIVTQPHVHGGGLEKKNLIRRMIICCSVLMKYIIKILVEWFLEIIAVCLKMFP